MATTIDKTIKPWETLDKLNDPETFWKSYHRAKTQEEVLGLLYAALKRDLWIADPEIFEMFMFYGTSDDPHIREARNLLFRQLLQEFRSWGLTLEGRLKSEVEVVEAQQLRRMIEFLSETSWRFTTDPEKRNVYWFVRAVYIATLRKHVVPGSWVNEVHKFSIKAAIQHGKNNQELWFLIDPDVDAQAAINELLKIAVGIGSPTQLHELGQAFTHGNHWQRQAAEMIISLRRDAKIPVTVNVT